MKWYIKTCLWTIVGLLVALALAFIVPKISSDAVLIVLAILLLPVLAIIAKGK